MENMWHCLYLHLSTDVQFQSYISITVKTESICNVDIIILAGAYIYEAQINIDYSFRDELNVLY